MLSLTPVQKQILHAVIERDGWPVQSLFQLALDLGIDYRWARRCVRALEQAGLIQVLRPRGRDLLLTMNSTNEFWMSRGLLSGGTVFGNSLSSVRRSQNGEAMDPVLSLRASLTDEPVQYSRPELSPEEGQKYARVASKLNKIHDERLRLIYIATMACENARLVKEVNEHRATLGIAPLPVYDPEKK